jgi:flavin-dependent dehydrogenase
VADICVIGAGPAGSTFAARMAQLGHRVLLVERERFPRSHLGESLSAGIAPLLEVIGAREAIDAADFRRVRRVRVQWDGPLRVREDPREQGLLVDRGEFDRLLLEHARALGVRVLQPARVRARKESDDGWRVDLDSDAGAEQIRADFLAEATGRSSGPSGRKRRTGCRTLALYAYWRGPALPDEPSIEAGEEAWYWGVPLPDGSYNTLAFIDVKQFRGTRAVSLKTRFLDLLARSDLAAHCRDARLQVPVRAIDATPYLDVHSVTPSRIKVGEAALAVDPISSSGVQKAIQSALAGAIVANTLLRRPAAREAALQFYQANLTDASARHCRWAAGHYRSVATVRGGAFWEKRALDLESTPAQPPPTAIDAHSLAALRVDLSERLEFVELPCIEDNFVTTKRALCHPNLASPVAYLGGSELAPLLRRLPRGATPLQLAESWSKRMPLSSGLAIAGWLITNGILVETKYAAAREPKK